MIPAGAKIYDCNLSLKFGLFCNQVYSAFTGCGHEMPLTAQQWHINGRWFGQQEEKKISNFQSKNIVEISRLNLKWD